MSSDHSPPARLPAAFRELEPYVETWALPTMEARHRRRLECSEAERKAFYDAMAPRFEEVVDHLNGLAMDSMPGEARSLLLLSLALVDVSLSVEIFGSAHEAEHAYWAGRVEVACDVDQC